MRDHPRPLNNYPTDARDLSYLLIALAVLVSITAYSARVGFDRQAKAYETEGRV